MTRKDYKLIVDILLKIEDTKTRFFVAKYAAEKLQATNENFYREKFLDACIM